MIKIASQTAVVSMAFMALLAHSSTFAQATAYKTVQTTDGPRPTKEKSSAVECSLKAPDGNSFEYREKSYRDCVRDHKGPEYDKEMEKNIKEQGAYERANAAADRAKVYAGPAREVFVRSHMQAEGVWRK